MKINNYYIKWQYDDVKFININSIDEIRKSTKCVICHVDNPDDVLTYGLAICSPEDNFDKEKGRRLSFERAVGDYLQVVDDEDMVTKEYKFSKELRTEFWEGFRTLTLKPKW